MLFERLLSKREFQTDLTNTFIVMRYGDLIFLITFCIKAKSIRPPRRKRRNKPSKHIQVRYDISKNIMCFLYYATPKSFTACITI